MFEIAYAGYSVYNNEIIPLSEIVFQSQSKKMSFDTNQSANFSYFLLRDVLNENIDASDWSIDFIKDSTTSGIYLNGIIENLDISSYPDQWISSEIGNCLVIKVQNYLASQSDKIRIIEVQLKNIILDKFITFIFTPYQYNYPISYLIVNSKDFNNRPLSSNRGNFDVISLSQNSSYYILASGVDAFRESDEKTNYSYPFGSIFYTVDEVINNEEYFVEIKSSNYDTIIPFCKIYQLSNWNNRVSLIKFDKSLFNIIKEANFYRTPYIQFSIKGIKSNRYSELIIYLKLNTNYYRKIIPSSEAIPSLPNVTIRFNSNINNTNVLLSLRIDGSLSLLSNSSEKYNCIGTYDNLTDRDLSKQVIWSVSDDFGNIDSNGYFTADEVVEDTIITIAVTLQNSSGEEVMAATRNVLIRAITIGSGTIEDPYMIYSVEGLNGTKGLEDINDDVSAYYKLANSLNLSGQVYNSSIISPYGELQFSGQLDGNYYTISNLTIVASEGSAQIALAGRVASSGVVKNLYLTNVNIIGDTQVSGICAINNGQITQVYVSGNIQARDGYCGSVVAFNGTGAIIRRSVANCNVVARYYSGGFVGTSQPGSAIYNSYSLGKISLGSLSDPTRIGGFAGSISGTHLENNYSVTLLDGFAPADDVGGFSGFADTFVDVNNYWSSEASNYSSTASDLATDKTAAEMKLEETYLNWNFDSVWEISSNQCPNLRWE